MRTLRPVFITQSKSRPRRIRSRFWKVSPTRRKCPCHFSGIVGTRTFRPLALRRDSTFRPAAVAIRARNPWVLFRLIRLG